MTRLDAERRAQAARLANTLYENGAARVWLFGSLCESRTPDVRTDLDLAVEGLRRIEAIRVVTPLAREMGVMVDVVDADHLSPWIRLQYTKSRVLLEPSETIPNLLSESGRITPLAAARLDAVQAVLVTEAPGSIIDVGCGEGWLLRRLASTLHFTQLSGIDIDAEAIRAARARLRGTHVKLFHSTCTAYHPAMEVEAVVAIEVVEHFSTSELSRFTQLVFDRVRPPLVVMTTPNRAYNDHYVITEPSGLRHPDHQFEFDRASFRNWAQTQDHYQVQLAGIGHEDPGRGAPSQMAVWRRC